MPLNAYGVLATFVGASIAIGVLVTRLIGPRRPAAAILPVSASIVALGAVGHSLKLGFGPTVNLFGYDVRLPFDLALAAVVSIAVALVQRSVIRARASSK